MCDASRVLLLDNYDSFTWNLAQYLGELGAGVEVVLNDRISAEQAASGRYDAVVISPGPGRPEGAGVSLELIHQVAGRVPLLGVCLGHQAIGVAFGARVVRAPAPMHGKTSWIDHDETGLFRGLPRPFEATRYHSLVIDEATLPDEIRVNARSADGVVMGIEHRGLRLHGVQFHPESILTAEGKPLLANFLALVRAHQPQLA